MVNDMQSNFGNSEILRFKKNRIFRCIFKSLHCVTKRHFELHLYFIFS